MATPSSSATTPSPALSFAIPASASDMSVDDQIVDVTQREEARRKVLARAEFAKMTRALRTSLSLASYKAKHNLATVPLKSLEIQVAQSSRVRGPGFNSPGITGGLAVDRKRKSGGNYYNNPNSQASNIVASSAPTSSTLHHMGSPKSSASNVNANANATLSLFSTILAPPSPKRARTIRNPHASPIPAPSLPQPPAPASPTAKKGRGGKGKDKDRGKDKGKGKHEGNVASARGRSTTSGRGARAHTPSSTRSRSSIGTMADSEVAGANEVDIKAATTLTEILFSRPAASPRSSLSGGSGHSLTEVGSPAQHYAQSSTRLVHHGSSLSQSSVGSTALSHRRTLSNSSLGATISVEESDVRLHPDTHISRSATPTLTSTPRATRADDSEAADLMLLLANSPSPARPKVPVRDAAARSAYTGRVLCPTAVSASSFSAAGNIDGGGGILKRDGSGLGGGFSSTGTDLSGDMTLHGESSVASLSRAPTMLSISTTVPNSPRTSGEPIVTPPTPTPSGETGGDRSGVSTVQLLPALPSPSLPSLSTTTVQGQLSRQSTAGSIPLTPSSASFDMADYINVSPAPVLTQANTVHTPSRLRTSTTAASLSRGVSDVASRRIFDGPEPVARKLRFGDEAMSGTLGSSVDVVQT